MYDSQGENPRERILVVADVLGATQEIGFRRPFAALASAGTVTLDIHTGADVRTTRACTGLWKKIRPTVLILSRFAGAAESPLMDIARQKDVPVIFHIDDNLLDVPVNLGAQKYTFYNEAERKNSLLKSINASDLLYTSTQALRQIMIEQGVTVPVFSVDAFSTVNPEDLRKFRPRPDPVIGYMATRGHTSDLASIVPALVRLMNDIPNLRFETFGTIKMPVEMRAFPGRWTRRPAEDSYDAFLKTLHESGWWIGLAPLETHNFNLCKTDTKWVEYSQCAIPVVASKLLVYERACADGGGARVETVDQWHSVLGQLIEDVESRKRMVRAARRTLIKSYTHDRLVEQTLDIIDIAKQNRLPKVRGRELALSFSDTRRQARPRVGSPIGRKGA